MRQTSKNYYQRRTYYNLTVALNEVSLELNLINDCEPGVNLQAEIV